jgi:hypothetical protein
MVGPVKSSPEQAGGRPTTGENMEIHTVLKRAGAAALLSATIAAPAVLGLTAGTANAKPIESPNCRAMIQTINDGMYMANAARDQGDTKAAREYTRLAARASENHRRHCLS